MEIANLLFYSIFGAIMLVMFLGALKRYQSTPQSPYLAISLGLVSLSSFSFVLAGLLPVFFLSLANTGLIFSGIALVLFIRTWDPNIRSVKPHYFWIALLVFLIGYEFFRIYGSFEARVYFVSALVGGFSLLGLVETFLAPKDGKSFHYTVLKIAFVAQFAILAIRALSLTHNLLVTTVYQEETFTAILRFTAMSSVLLIYVSVNNILFEKLLWQEQKKAADSELTMLSSLNAVALARDNETGAHIVRTQEYVRCIAQNLQRSGMQNQLTNNYIDKLYRAAPLHDVGKVGIPDSILYKSSSLTKEEWGVMKTHTTIGENILNSAKSQLSQLSGGEVIELAVEIAGAHHEQWDGGGYPRGLKGINIPLSARIMALADMYDALISKRAYKHSWSHEEAVNEIVSRRGSHFDPQIVDAFIAESGRFESIAQIHRDAAVESEPSPQTLDTSEQKLRRSEEKFEFLFEHSPIGMAMVDFETGEFVEVNNALLAYTQYTKTEFLKLSFWDITPPQYQAQEEAQLRDLTSKGSFGPNRKEYIRKDGTRFPISIRGFILSDVDGRKLVWGIIEDLSQYS